MSTFGLELKISEKNLIENSALGYDKISKKIFLGTESDGGALGELYLNFAPKGENFEEFSVF
jgi:hypothetical protein